MKPGAGLQARGSSTEVPPSRCPARRWNWAQPGPWPSNTFHRGRLLGAHTGRGRAAELGTLRAWERAARKEPRGWQGPGGPLARPCTPAAPSLFLAFSHPHPAEAPRYIPSTQARGPNRHQHVSRRARAYQEANVPSDLHAHTPTRAHGCGHANRCTQIQSVHTEQKHTETQADAPHTHTHTTHTDTCTEMTHPQPPYTQKHAHLTGTRFARAHITAIYKGRTPPPNSDTHQRRLTHTSLV